MIRISRRAFTLVELLVVIAMIGILVAMMLPGIQASRETARRAQCVDHLRTIGQGLSRYYGAYECFPAGVENPTRPIRNEPQGRHVGWICPLLPYVDAAIYASKLDVSESVYAAENDEVRRTTLSVVTCPSFPGNLSEEGWAVSNYAGCHHDEEAPINTDNHGVFILNQWLTEDDISDGLAFTLFVGEKGGEPGDLGWASGTRATLRNTGEAPQNWLVLQRKWQQPKTVGGNEAEKEKGDPALRVGGFASAHPGVVEVLFGSGNVKGMAWTIDPKVWKQLAARADGSLPAVSVE